MPRREVHIAVIGAGRVGRPTAYTIMASQLADILSIVDIKPNLAKAFAEELKQVAVSMRLDVEINYFDRCENLSGADYILISAGYSRPPGIKVTRRDLVRNNAKIIRSIAESIAPNNRGAFYIMITNPVDAMATLFMKVSREKKVISAGNHLDTLRMRAKIADMLKVPYCAVDGYVGGEHGAKMTILWSTVKVYGEPVDEFAKSRGMTFNREEVVEYLREIPVFIIDNIGATEYGPAAAFRDIVKALVFNTGEILSIGVPRRFEGLPEEVHVNIPIRVGQALGPDIFHELTQDEQKAITEAARSIYEVYEEACRLAGLAE